MVKGKGNLDDLDAKVTTLVEFLNRRPEYINLVAHNPAEVLSKSDLDFSVPFLPQTLDGSKFSDLLSTHSVRERINILKSMCTNM